MTHANVTVGADLSKLEYDTLLLVAQGMTNEQIAHHMGGSIQTVKNRLFIVYSKLDVQSRIEALHAMGWIMVPGQ